jgi:crossover junction endodeoxyribonuclease RuvC
MAAKAEKIILGIDPGTNLLGYGIIRVEGKKKKRLMILKWKHIHQYLW